MQKGQKSSLGIRRRELGELKEWLKQDWVRIGTDGKIKGKCGTSKDKKNLIGVFQAKAQSLSQKKEPLPLVKKTEVKRGRPSLKTPNKRK